MKKSTKLLLLILTAIIVIWGVIFIQKPTIEAPKKDPIVLFREFLNGEAPRTDFMELFQKDLPAKDEISDLINFSLSSFDAKKIQKIDIEEDFPSPKKPNYTDRYGIIYQVDGKQTRFFLQTANKSGFIFDYYLWNELFPTSKDNGSTYAPDGKEQTELCNRYTRIGIQGIKNKDFTELFRGVPKTLLPWLLGTAIKIYDQLWAGIDYDTLAKSGTCSDVLVTSIMWSDTKNNPLRIIVEGKFWIAGKWYKTKMWLVYVTPEWKILNFSFTKIQ